MADKKISELVELTTPVITDVVPVVDSATTKKITLKNLIRRPSVFGGIVSGAVTIDLSIGNTFVFTLGGDVDVTLENAKDGEKFYFVVENGNNFNVNSFAITGGSIISTPTNPPHVTHNSTDIFEAICVGNDLFMWTHKNLQ